MMDIADGLPTITTVPTATAAYENSDFESHLRDNSTEGTNLLGHKAWYVSLPALEAFWEEDIITAVLHRRERPIPADARTIRTSYLRVWSTLVHIGRPEFIEHFFACTFEDTNLPLKPGGGPTSRTPSQVLADTLEVFRAKQWLFIPVEFRKLGTGGFLKRQLDNRHVLPIKYGKTLSGEAPYPIVKEVLLHDSCTDYPDKRVVFKEFQGPEGRRAWDKEIRTFLTLANCEYVVKYLGSFEQGGKLVIILEHANRGSLLDFLKTNQQPIDAEQVKKFWEPLMKLLWGLYALHHAQSDIGSAHRDIKPANILLYDDGGGGTFDIRMKLADFDRASGPQRNAGVTGMGTQDKDGSLAYCAPEASRIYIQETNTTMKVPHKCDLWSLACVISECLAWMAGGEELRRLYQKEREEETIRDHNMGGTGYEACFHDGANVLRCVTAMHERAMSSLRGFDNYSPIIRRLIEDFMLVPHDRRLDARDAVYRFQRAWESPPLQRGVSSPSALGTEQILSSSVAGGVPALTATPAVFAPQGTSHSNLPWSEPLPVASPRSDFERSLPGPRPNKGLGLIPAGSPASSSTVTRNNSHASRYGQEPTQARVNHPTDLAVHGSAPVSPSGQAPSVSHAASPTAGRIEERSAPYPHVPVEVVLAWKASKKSYPLPGREKILQDLRGRRQVFVIDDSSSMRPHRATVMDVSKSLMCLVKDCDGNRIEMRFASEPRRVYKGRSCFRTSTKKLVKQIGDRFDVRGDRGGCNMEQKLSSVVDDVVHKGRCVSILVLTDGVWEGANTSPGGGVENTILRLVKTMGEEGVNRTDVSIQFIRFGDDPDGVGRLTYLDDGLKKDHSVLDIVDHRHHTESVWHMLIGSVSEAGDNYPSAAAHVGGEEKLGVNHHVGQRMSSESPA